MQVCVAPQEHPHHQPAAGHVLVHGRPGVRPHVRRAPGLLRLCQLHHGVGLLEIDRYMFIVHTHRYIVHREIDRPNLYLIKSMYTYSMFVP